MTNAEARFSNSLRPRKPEGSLGRTAQDGHLDSHTAPDLRMHAGGTRFIVSSEGLVVESAQNLTPEKSQGGRKAQYVTVIYPLGDHARSC